jgi:hypothetical protein
MTCVRACLQVTSHQEQLDTCRQEAVEQRAILVEAKQEAGTILEVTIAHQTHKQQLIAEVCVCGPSVLNQVINSFVGKVCLTQFGNSTSARLHRLSEGI